jgi:hypothetical protein
VRTRKTMNQIRARARAKAMLRDPYYKELRGWHFGLGAKQALKAVRELDALFAQIAAAHPQNKLRGVRE